MKAEIVTVTPQMAADWLSLNCNNRTLRRATVEGLKSAFRRGEYIQTHQGIAFAQNGELLDGQHRLTAISELRDGAFPMLVIRGLDNEAFRVMDIGVKRTPADALRSDDKRLVEIARLIAAICTNKRGSITPTLLLPIMEDIERQHSSLIAFCPSVAKTWSSTPVRLGAVVAMASGVNPDYVRATYRSLVTSDFDAMPPVARALYRSSVNGLVRAADWADMLSRCIVVFTEKKANNTKVQVKSPAEAPALVRTLYGHLVATDDDTQDKKTATPNGAAKGVLPAKFNRLHRAA